MGAYHFAGIRERDNDDETHAPIDLAEDRTIQQPLDPAVKKFLLEQFYNYSTEERQIVHTFSSRLRVNGSHHLQNVEETSAAVLVQFNRSETAQKIIKQIEGVIIFSPGIFYPNLFK